MSSFRVSWQHLILGSVVDSQGVFSVSLTEHNDVGYVLNAGSREESSGRSAALLFLLGAWRCFPYGRIRLGDPVMTPFNIDQNTGGSFSFVFADAETLVVVHANSGTIASHAIEPNHSVSLLEEPLPVESFAVCWIVQSGRYVYTLSFGAIDGFREIFHEGTGRPDLNADHPCQWLIDGAGALRWPGSWPRTLCRTQSRDP